MVLPICTGSCPSSASSWYSKPPEVDRPMIGGRLKAMMLASRIDAACANTSRIRACAESAAARRSSKGFSLITMKASFASAAWSSNE